MQEFKQIKLADSIGKKIVAIKVAHCKHIIKYDDGSFSFFERYEEWGSSILEDTKLKYEVFIQKLNVQNDGRVLFTETQQFLIDLGILDGNKLIEDGKNKINERIAEIEMRERKEYERLKYKFGKHIL